MMNYNGLIKKIVHKENAVPRDDFDGFSSNEMGTIIYQPFAEECSIRVCSQLSGEHLNQSPIFQIAMHILKAINDNEGIKLTSKGYLPPRLVTKIYDKKYILDSSIELGISKLNQEIKWTILHCTKIVLKVAKLIRAYKGKLLLTKQTQKDLKNGEDAKLFNIFFSTFTVEFNWAYNDYFEDENVGQTGFLYLLYLINKYGAKFRELSYYSDLYFKAFPVFKTSEESLLGVRGNFTLTIRFFERFAEWFGFVEIRGEKHALTGELIEVRRTELLNHLLL